MAALQRDFLGKPQPFSTPLCLLPKLHWAPLVSDMLEYNLTRLSGQAPLLPRPGSIKGSSVRSDVGGGEKSFWGVRKSKEKEEEQEGWRVSSGSAGNWKRHQSGGVRMEGLQRHVFHRARVSQAWRVSGCRWGCAAVTCPSGRLVL